MTIRRVAGFTALGSFVAMIAMMVALVVQIARQPVPEQGGIIGFVALADAPGMRDILMSAQQLAVLNDLRARWDIRSVRPLTYEAMDGLPVAVVMLRRPMSYSEAIDLDVWVRDGGRALILAEPGKGWPAPDDAVDANLRSATWDLRLAAREDGPLALPGGGTLLLNNAGRWTASTGCNPRQDGFLTECRPGKGRVVLVGDTGLLDRNSFDLQGDAQDSATGMIGQLVEALERGRPLPTAFVRGGGNYSRVPPPMALIMAMGTLFWVALGSVAVWAVLLGMAKTARDRPTGPARIVRDPVVAGPARIVRQSVPAAPTDDPEGPR